MKQALSLFAKLSVATLRSQMEYRFSFVATSIILGLSMASDFLSTGAILLRFRSIGGWSLPEIALLYAITNTAWNLHRLFFTELYRFENYILRGEFDGLLVRPWPPLVMLCARGLDVRRVFGVLPALAIGFFCIRTLLRQEALRAGTLLHLLALPLWGAVLFSALGLLIASMAFWIVRTSELSGLVTGVPQYAATLPMTIYPRWLRDIFFTVVPVAYVSYVPMRYMLNKGGTALALVAPPLASTISLSVAYAIWLIGQHRYESTGS